LLRHPATGELADPTMDGQEFDTLAHTMMAENHTGNHRPHLHTVRIPTAAGQPVRG
jgi:hypothetical protein